MTLKLRPVKMKNSLYLLIPKSISELLEIDQSRECVLATESTHGQVLKYAFLPKAHVNELLQEPEKETRRRASKHEAPPKLSHMSP
jgi:hypothetical protein